jgi:hypothetical protein
MRKDEIILAGFAIGATLWILLYPELPWQKKWDAVFNRFCEEKHWDPKDLNPEQEQAARNAADSVLDALIQEGTQ